MPWWILFDFFSFCLRVFVAVKLLPLISSWGRPRLSYQSYRRLIHHQQSPFAVQNHSLSSPPAPQLDTFIIKTIRQKKLPIDSSSFYSWSWNFSIKKTRMETGKLMSKSMSDSKSTSTQSIESINQFDLFKKWMNFSWWLPRNPTPQLGTFATVIAIRKARTREHNESLMILFMKPKFQSTMFPRGSKETN